MVTLAGVIRVLLRESFPSPGRQKELQYLQEHICTSMTKGALENITRPRKAKVHSLPANVQESTGERRTSLDSGSLLFDQCLVRGTAV